MNKNKQSLKTIFTEAVEHYRQKDFKTLENNKYSEINYL